MSWKWLTEILKASGWQTTAIAVAFGVLLYANAKKLLPVPLDPRIAQLAEVALLVCGCLSLASITSAIVKSPNGPRAKLNHWLLIRRVKQQVVKDIPQMTAKEIEIIGYLLANNQRMFPTTEDAGYANTLVSKGILVRAMLPGQAYSRFAIPFEVPEHVWDVLLEHKAKFPYTPTQPRLSLGAYLGWRARTLAGYLARLSDANSHK